ncbi:hypothetical protein P170DRAFT_434751, partial [Aspergillus steynii IBT 23096]
LLRMRTSVIINLPLESAHHPDPGKWGVRLVRNGWLPDHQQHLSQSTKRKTKQMTLRLRRNQKPETTPKPNPNSNKKNPLPPSLPDSQTEDRRRMSALSSLSPLR